MAKDETCKVCHQPLIEGCRNKFATAAEAVGGIIHRYREDGEMYAVTCPNIRRAEMKKFLDSIHPRLATATHVKTSPLWQPGRDRTLKDLFFERTQWKTFLNHLKWVAGNKGSNWIVEIITDYSITDTFVGNTGYKARPQKDREDGGVRGLRICNSISDLMPHPDLMIIQLGTFTYFNKSASAALHDALRLRFHLGKPTWLVESPQKAFQPHVREHGVDVGMTCCDDKVLAFVRSNYKRLRLKAKSAEEYDEQEGGDYEDEDDFVSLGREEPLDGYNAREELEEEASEEYEEGVEEEEDVEEEDEPVVRSKILPDEVARIADGPGAGKSKWKKKGWS